MLEVENSLDVSAVKERAAKGALTLTGRMFLVQAISFFGFFLLTIFLDKAEIGLFFAVSELVAILGYFSDVGLAAALIQKKEEPSREDIRSTFTIQQILVITLCILVLAFSPWLRRFYNIPPAGIWLLLSLVFGFFLASLKTIPSVLLERKLKFGPLVLVELAESLFFYGIAVFFAWRGFGVLSYALAILFRGFVGVILIYIISPWQIGLAISKESLKHLLKFGAPYQANTFLAVIKDRLMNVFLWRIIGATGVGILGWAQKWAQMPLRFIMDSVMKVTFPAYARIQESKEELRRAVEKTLFFMALLVFPILTGISFLAEPLVNIIPRYQKWDSALLALYFYCFNSAWAAVTTPLTNALAAIGKMKVVFKLMIMWTSLTWIFFPLLAAKFGYNGVALASAIVSMSSVVAIILANKYINFRFFSAVGKPMLASLIMAIFLFLMKNFLGQSLISLIALCLFGGAIYAGASYLLMGNSLLIEVKKFANAIKK